MDNMGTNAINLTLHGDKLLLSIDFASYWKDPKGQYCISLFDCDKREFVYRGNLPETIELILIGKAAKEALPKVGVSNE